MSIATLPRIVAPQAKFPPLRERRGDRAGGALQELVNLNAKFLPLTVAQYDRMIKTGILTEGEPYELLEGFLVRKDRSAAGEDPVTIGDEHVWAVYKLAGLDGKLRRLGCHMRIQAPVSLPPHDQPEPDGAVVLGLADDYMSRRPYPADVLCVIEVSDSSLRRDRTTKLRIYAAAGIGCYVIINLPDRLIEVYTNPDRRKGRYAPPAILSRKQSLALPAPGGRRLVVPARNLLPQP